MTKEYTGKEFEIEFARAWLKYVEGGKVGVDPHRNWQYSAEEKWHTHDFPCQPSFSLINKYRWKPAPKRMVRIGFPDKHCDNGWKWRELVAPEVEAPARGSVYYHLGCREALPWTGSGIDTKWIEAGEVFLTREDAAAMSEWLAVCRKGGAV